MPQGRYPLTLTTRTMMGIAALNPSCEQFDSSHAPLNHKVMTSSAVKFLSGGISCMPSPSSDTVTSVPIATG